MDFLSVRGAVAEKSIHAKDACKNRVVGFILRALERHLSAQDFSFTSDAFGIEHVLPQNASDSWGGFSNEAADALVYRLGNMTLMQSAANRDAGNQEYRVKREAYRQSDFAITGRIAAENADWSPERIAAHQGWMAEQATSLWPIAQLG